MKKIVMFVIVTWAILGINSHAQDVTQMPSVDSSSYQQGHHGGTAHPLEENYNPQAVIILPASINQQNDVNDQDKSWHKNEDRSLNVQKEIAQANTLSAQYSFLQILLSVFGAMLLLATLLVSLWTARETRKIGQASVRAYLTVTPENISDIEIGQPLTAQFSIKNNGNSPAYDMNYVAALFISAPKEANYSGTLVTPALEVYPRGKAIMANSETHGEAITSSAINSTTLREITFTKTKIIHLAGHVYYRDVFKRSHHIKFCYVFEFVNVTPEGQEQYGWHLAHYHNEVT